MLIALLTLSGRVDRIIILDGSFNLTGLNFPMSCPSGKNNSGGT